MKKLNLLLLLLLYIFPFNPIPLALNAQPLDPQLELILNKALDSMRISLNVKSLSAAVQIGETGYWAGAKGISSQNPYVEVTTDDVYLIGSVVKTITSTCILQLVDEGKLSLDDSLHTWLEPIPFINENITIRQLLRHQSGLFDFLNNPNAQPIFLAYQDSVWSQDDLLQTFMLAPKALPGGNWDYCNTNYLLLGMIIKKLTGNYFYEEFRNRFFTPLEMTSIAIPSFEELKAPVAHVWLDITGDGVSDDAHDFYINYLSLNSAASSAGGYFATARETAKWIRKFMKGDLVSAEKMIEAFKTIASPGLPGGTYGLGVMKKSFNGIVGYGHQGDLVYSASAWYFPSKDIGISVLCNDSKNTSHTLSPVISVLQKKVMDYMMSVNTVEPASGNDVSLTAWPNPVGEILNIYCTSTRSFKNAKASLCSADGKVVKLINKIEINPGVNKLIWDDLSLLSSGVYYLTMAFDTDLTQTITIIK